MRSTLAAVALVLASLLLAGCGSGRTDPPNATLRVVHAAPSVGPVTFKRVRANATTYDYKGSSLFSFDADTYTFNLEILAVDGSVAQTLSLMQTLENGTDYTLVLREIGGLPAATVIEAPARGTSASGTQLQLLHAATTLTAVDVFFEPAGFDLAAATPWGSLNYDDVLAPRLFTNGDYEFVITETGNRANVLLASTPFTVSGAQNIFLFIADGANTSLAPITLAIADGDGIDIVDKDLLSGIRVLNAVSDRNAIDAGLDLELMPPLIQALPFGTVSDQTLIASGDHQLNITPAGNPGVIEIDQAFTAERASLSTWFITGSPGALSAAPLDDDFRLLPGESKLRIFNGSPLNDILQVYVVAPGTNLATIPATQILASGTASPNRRFAPGEYELTVRSAVDNRVLLGPQPLTIAADGYYAILLSDPLSGTGIDVQLLYDFN